MRWDGVGVGAVRAGLRSSEPLPPSTAGRSGPLRGQIPRKQGRGRWTEEGGRDPLLSSREGGREETPPPTHVRTEGLQQGRRREGTLSHASSGDAIVRHTVSQGDRGRWGSRSHSSRSAPRSDREAQCAFENIMTHEGMHVTNVIAFHHVLHHNGNQDIHC